MATLATTYRGVIEAQTTRAREKCCGLPALPNEDVYFFVKRIDNTRVVRTTDPASREICWKAIAGVTTTAGLLICLLLPGAYSLLAGFQIHRLQQEQQQLLRDQAALELDEARLLSPERLEELARIQAFIDPAPERVQHLEPKESLALNVGSDKK